VRCAGGSTTAARCSTGRSSPCAPSRSAPRTSGDARQPGVEHAHDARHRRRRPARAPAAIKDGTRHAKDQAGAIGAEVLTEWAEFAAPAVAARPPGSTPARGWRRATARSTT
jgi:hypothetical protein